MDEGNLCVVGSLNDVNVLHEREVELMRSNRALEELAVIATHEMREPLRMIELYLALLVDRSKGKLDVETQELMQTVVKSSRRMKVFIDNLLNFSRADRFRENFELVDGVRILEETLSLLKPMLDGNRVRMIRDPLPKFIGSRSLLVQLFANLIQNAIKFRGKVPLEIKISAERTTKEWVFSVQDNGIGIPREHFDDIFVMFRRLHAHSEYSGSGIGLAFCKKIVDHHRGRIWVESEVGKGSTFFFSIPDPQ